MRELAKSSQSTAGAAAAPTNTDTQLQQHDGQVRRWWGEKDGESYGHLLQQVGVFHSCINAEREDVANLSLTQPPHSLIDHHHTPSARPPPIEAVRVHGALTACMTRASDTATPECLYFRDGVHLTHDEDTEHMATSPHSTAALLKLSSCLCVVNGIDRTQSGAGLQPATSSLLSSLLQARSESAKEVRMAITVRALRQHDAESMVVEDILSGRNPFMKPSLLSSSLERMEINSKADANTVVKRLGQRVYYKFEAGEAPSKAVAVVVVELRTARSRIGQQPPFAPDTFYPTVGTQVYLVEVPPSRSDVLTLLASRSPKPPDIDTTGPYNIVKLLRSVVAQPRNLLTIVAKLEDTFKKRENTLEVMRFARQFQSNVMLSALAGPSQKTVSPGNRTSPRSRVDEAAWNRIANWGSQSRQQRRLSDPKPPAPSTNKTKAISLAELELAEADAVAASKIAWDTRRKVAILDTDRIVRIQATFRGYKMRSALLVAANATTVLRAAFVKMRAHIRYSLEESLTFGTVSALLAVKAVRTGRRFAHLFKRAQAVKDRWLAEAAAEAAARPIAAATTIQSAYRGSAAREEVRVRQQEKAEAEAKIREEMIAKAKLWLAKTLQSAFRGARVRKQIRIFKHVAGLLLAGVEGPEFSRALKHLSTSLLSLVDPRLRMPLLHYAIHSRASQTTLKALYAHKADVNLAAGRQRTTPLLLALQVRRCE